MRRMEEKISWRGGEMRLNNNDHLCSYTTSEFTMWLYLFWLSWFPPLWVEKCTVTSKMVSAMRQLLQRKMAVLHEGRSLGAVGANKNPKCLKQWLAHYLCTVGIWWIENVQFPAEGSALCHPSLSQVILSLPGQSWVAKRNSVSETEMLNGHSLLPVGPAANERLKWKFGPNESKISQSISHRNFN